MEESAQTRHAPMNNKTRARRKPQVEWERLKPIICELYANKTLEEVREILKNDYNIQATKRQLVYRLEKWEMRRYNIGEPESSRGEDENTEDLTSNRSLLRPRPTRVLKSPLSPARLIPLKVAKSTRDLRPPLLRARRIPPGFARITDESEVFNATNPLSNDNRQDSEPDYPELTRLMIQYMQEAMASGEVFMDSADHVGNGWRLFSWAHGATEAIEATRTSSISDITATPAWKYLSDDVSLENIIVDENPFILGTIFTIWKKATMVNDGAEMSRMFLCAVLRSCERLLAPHHHITGIFKCLANGRFDPASCIDRLAVLPSEIFSRGTGTLDPSFEFDRTSDYQTISSMPIRQYQPGFSNTELPQLRGLGHDDTSGFTDGFDTIPIGPMSNAGLTFDARSQYQGFIDNLALGTSVSVPSSSMIKHETEHAEMIPQEKTPGSIHGSLSGSISTYSSPEPQTLESEKRRIVDSVMREFLENLDTYLAELYEDDGTGGARDGGDGSKNQSDNKGKAVSQSTDRRKRNRSGKYVKEAGGEGGDGADDGDNQRDGGSSKKPKLGPDEGRSSRLACPYFKWNPRKYRHHRVCVSPGWKSVHRVKEHLQRCHEKPLYRCRRCHQDLKEEAALEMHQREDPPCDIVVLSEPCDKYGTEKASRLRKRSDGKKSEKDQWIELYRILFDVRDDELPSPYCEDFNLAFQSESWPEHVQREARPLLRELLATQVAQALTNIAPEILHHLRDLVRQLEPTLRRSYQYSQDQDRDQDHNQNQQGEKVVDEEDEEDEEEEEEEEVNRPASRLHLTPIPHSSSNIPHALTSTPVPHGPPTDTSTNISYSSASIADNLTLNFTSAGYHEGHNVDAFSQFFNPSIDTWPAELSATNRLQSGSFSGPTVANTGGLSIRDQSRLAPAYGQQDATDLQGWSLLGEGFAYNDTSFDWGSWQTDFGGGYGASPGGGGPSRGT